MTKETKRCECEFCLESRVAGQKAFDTSRKRNRTNPQLRATVWRDKKEDIFPTKILVSKEHFESLIGV